MTNKNLSSTQLNNPEISIVVPVYKNTETLHELHRRLTSVLEDNKFTFEILFVNDACPSGSLQVLREIARNDPRVTVLALKRNVRQHRAVLAGLTFSQGKRVVILDADLQDPPEAIPELLSKLDKGFAAVFGGRCGDYESRFRLFTSRLFKKILHWVTGLPSDACMFVALRRQMAERLLAFYAPRPFIVAMIGCTGLPFSSIPVKRDKRPIGQSAYSFWMRLRTGCLAIFWALVWKYCSALRISGRRGYAAFVESIIGPRSCLLEESQHGSRLSS